MKEYHQLWSQQNPSSVLTLSPTSCGSHGGVSPRSPSRGNMLFQLSAPQGLPQLQKVTLLKDTPWKGSQYSVTAWVYRLSNFIPTWATTLMGRICSRAPPSAGHSLVVPLSRISFSLCPSNPISPQASSLPQVLLPNKYPAHQIPSQHLRPESQPAIPAKYSRIQPMTSTRSPNFLSFLIAQILQGGTDMFSTASSEAACASQGFYTLLQIYVEKT